MNELVTKMHILLKGRVLMMNLERLAIKKKTIMYLLLCIEMNLHDPLLILVHLSKIYILSSVYRTFLAQ